MTRGRPREFDEGRALEAAMIYFWRKGYEATSLRDLLRTMGLSKSSFYQAFQGKRELFEICLRRYQDRVAGEMLGRLERARSGRSFIEGTFRDAVNETRDKHGARGCLLMNSAGEFSQGDPAVARLVAEGMERLSRVFARAVRQAQKEGDIPRRKNPESLARYLLTSMSGVRTMVKAGEDGKSLRQTVRVILQALD